MAKAVVGSNVGGLRELIHEGDTGVLCRPDDPDDLARVLCVLAHAPEHRRALGDRARQWVCAERDWRRVVAQHVQIYENLLRCRRQRRPEHECSG
jgi:glycosyltransferase involved in cell wall biosynthesis